MFIIYLFAMLEASIQKIDAHSKLPENAVSQWH